jgi:hypothetical protein
LIAFLAALLAPLPLPAAGLPPLPDPPDRPFELSEPAGGSFDVGSLAVFGDSSDAPDEDDPQVYDALKPDMVLRSWFADRGDDTPPDQYDLDFRDLCQEHHILFMAGLNASAIYPAQAANLRQFNDWATQDSQGKPVTHPEYKQPRFLASLRTAPPTRGDSGAGRLMPPVMQRGSLANPRFRARLMRQLEAQIDLGADGVVLAESDALGYRANADKGYNGDEGYDPSAMDDFNQYLLDRYPDYREADWRAHFQMGPDNSLAWNAAHGPFNYQRYLQAHGWTDDPRNRAGQPGRALAGEWGDLTHPGGSGDGGGSGYLAKSLAYDQKLLILKLRKYARATRHREIVVAAQGMLPDVDVNEYPLTGDNHDAGGQFADYVPTDDDGGLDGTRSLLPVFRALRRRSRRISGRALLVLYLSLDPLDYARAYGGLTEDEKEDYWRIYLPEAYACGAFMAFHLRESLGQAPSSAQSGVLPFMVKDAQFFKLHRDLFTGADDGGRGVRCADDAIACNVTEQAWWRRSMLHLINHHYGDTMEVQRGFNVEVASDTAPVQAYLVSPDLASSVPVPFSFQGQQVTLRIPALRYYDVVVLKWPVDGPRRHDETPDPASPTPPPALASLPTATLTATLTATPAATPPAFAARPLPAPAPAAPAGEEAPASAPAASPSAAPAADPAATRPPASPTQAAPAAPSPTVPCTPGRMTVSKRVWVRPVLGDTRALGVKAVLRLGQGPGDQPQYSLPFTLSASARVWGETEILAGLPQDTQAAPKVFMDDQFLGFILVKQWRSSEALLLPPGLHHLTVRPSESNDVGTVTLGRVRALSDDNGHWVKATETKACGCGGPPCPPRP